jgi:MFS family permease
VLRPYRAVLSLPGAAAFSAAGMLARLPISMLGIGLVLLVSDASASFGLAGLVAATCTLVSAVAGPMVARLVDRHGQRRVLPVAVAIHAVGLVCLLFLVAAAAPPAALVAAAALAGAGFPPVGSLVRSRWSFLFSGDRRQEGGGDPRLQTAFAWESIVDELIFIVGPPLTILIATQGSPTAALLLILGALIAGTALLLPQRRTEPPGRLVEGSAGGRGVREPALVVIVVTLAAIGAVFGTVEVVTIAFAQEQGRPGAAGFPLALYALGSLIAGLAYGTVRWRVPVAQRFAAGCVLMVSTLVPLPFVDSLLGLCLVLFLAGAAIAPTLIAGFAATERAVPAGRLTEGLTWATTGIAIGIAAGAALAGRVIDAVGARPAYTVAVAGAGLAAVVAVAGARRVSRAVRRREGSAGPEGREGTAEPKPRAGS